MGARNEIADFLAALLGDEQLAITDLHGIRSLGVRVALDDFGTGYSSLTHLRIFPFDKIKIDRSFVKDAAQQPECAAVIKAVADLGRRLGVTTVAEGVETAHHLECIRAEVNSKVSSFAKILRIIEQTEPFEKTPTQKIKRYLYVDS